MGRQLLGVAPSRTPDSISLSWLDASEGRPSYAGGRDNPWVPQLSAFNFKASNTRKLRQDIQSLRRGGAAHWTAIGDSMGSGFVGGSGAATGYDVLGAWPLAMRNVLNRWWGIPVAGTGIVQAAQYDNEATFVETLSLGSRWTATGAYLNNGAYFQLGTGAASVTFYSDQPGTSVDLFWFSSSGTFTWTIDGVSQGSLTGAGGATMNRTTVTGLANGRHTVAVTWSSGGAVFLKGVDVYSANGLFVHNFCTYGELAQTVATDTTISDATPGNFAALDTLGATITRVVFVNLGANDITGGRTKAQLTADLVAIRNLARFAGADCIFVVPHRENAQTTTQQNDTRDAIYDAADSTDCPLVDLYDRHGTTAQMLADGVVISADSTHYTAAGQRMTGQHIANTLVTLSDSPLDVVPPSDPFPVKVLSTSNVATMSGRQTVDGQVCVPEDAVCLTAQSTASQNGVWTVKEGSWVRHPMFATSSQVSASSVRVLRGTYAGQLWQTSFKEADTLDTTAMYWTPHLSTLNSRLTSAPTSTVVTFAGTGLSVNVEAGKTYKIQCRGQYRTAATTTGIALRIGGTATATGIRYETTIYGLTTSTYTHQTGSTMGAAQAASTGVQAANTDYGFTVEGEIRVNAAGTVTLDFASEVAASTVTVQADSTLQLEEMP
jgi:hypothetical protein